MELVFPAESGLYHTEIESDGETLSMSEGDGDGELTVITSTRGGSRLIGLGGTVTEKAGEAEREVGDLVFFPLDDTEELLEEIQEVIDEWRDLDTEVEEPEAAADDEDAPEVFYVPGGGDHYIPDTDVVVLDERLKDYPKAHDHIREHEIGHGRPRNQGFFGLLWYELRNDVEQAFRRDEVMEEVDRYLEETHRPAVYKYVLVNQIRGFWRFLLIPAGRLYHGVRRLIGR